jgi:GNAT superfamily N-acetyltransferase
VNGTGVRMTVAEVAELARARQLFVARAGGRLVGCVRVERLSADVGELGMLAAAATDRGLGVGRGLVEFAEGRARAGGQAVMQLRLLVPRGWTHPFKDRLDRWYRRIGYRPVRTDRIDDLHPDLVPLLATECDFVVYHKDLRSG